MELVECQYLVRTVGLESVLSYMKHVVSVRIHFLVGDQLKLNQYVSLLRSFDRVG
jgi:hypothetical protein